MKQILLGVLLLLNVASYKDCDESQLNMTVHISPQANRNNPAAVDLVLVSDKKLLTAVDENVGQTVVCTEASDST